MTAEVLPRPERVLLELDTAVFDRFHSVRSGLAAAAAVAPDLTGGRAPGELAAEVIAVLDHQADDGRLTDSADPAAVARAGVLSGVAASGQLGWGDAYTRGYQDALRPVPRLLELLARLADAGIPAFAVAGKPREQALRTLVEIGGLPYLTDVVAGPVPASGKDVLVHGSTSRARAAVSGVPVSVLYCPVGPVTPTARPVVRSVADVAVLLGVAPHLPSEGRRPHSDGWLDIAADLVTVPQHCLHLSHADVTSIAELVGELLAELNRDDLGAVAGSLIDLVIRIVDSSPLLDRAALSIVRPGPAQEPAPASPPRIIRREHSVAFDFAVPFTGRYDGLARELLTVLRDALDLLAIDYPRAACRRLRQGVLAVLAQDPTLTADVRGQGIDEAQA